MFTTERLKNTIETLTERTSETLLKIPRFILSRIDRQVEKMDPELRGLSVAVVGVVGLLPGYLLLPDRMDRAIVGLVGLLATAAGALLTYTISDIRRR